MSSSLSDIEIQAKKLSPEDRARLAESLLESLHVPMHDIESVWAKEIEERVAAYDRGESKTYDAADVFAKARRLHQVSHAPKL